MSLQVAQLSGRPLNRLVPGQNAAQTTRQCKAQAAAVRTPRKEEVRMIPLQLPDQSHSVSTADDLASVPRILGRQPTPAKASQPSQQQSTNFSGNPSYDRPSNGSNGSYGSSRSNGATQTANGAAISNGRTSGNGDGRRGLGRDAGRLNGSNTARDIAARQVQVEVATAAAADMMSSPSGTRMGTGEIIVNAEFADTGYRDVPMDANFTWAQDSYSKQQRTIQIWSSLALLRTRLWLADNKWTYPGGFTEAKQAVRRSNTAVWLRGVLLDLGPTFVKLGQLFSTRSDLLSAEYTEELALLQDRVPAFPLEKVRSIIQAELGAPPEALFAAFDERPLAAASLGQVHRARLADGSQVVVKIQRPGLRELFEIDLEQLGKVAALLDAQDEGRRDLKGIHAECATILYQEIDYINEGRNADRFRRNFAGVSWVQTPRVFWNATSPRVITLSYMPGTKITDVVGLAASGVDTKLVAKRATEAYLLQILRHGFLHADPHPGNLAVGPGGELLFYDFGMMSSTAGSREKLLDVFYGIYRQDAEQVIKALVDLKIIVPTADMVSVRRAMAYFLKNFQQATQREETIAAIGEDVFTIALDQPFRFPATFTFVLRAFSTLEGLGKALDPEYSFSEVAKPYALELLNLQDAQQAQGFVLERLQEQAVQLGSDAAAMPARVANMDSMLMQMEAGELKLRTRSMESERADRRQAVLQGTTVNAVAVAGLANMATQFGLAGQAAPAWVTSIGAAGFAFFVWQGFRRIKRLDKFEKEIKG